MICVSTGKKERLQDLLASGPDIVEIRYDLMGCNPREIHDMTGGSTKMVATCRPGTMLEDERINLLIEAIDLGAAYVDLEIESDNGSIKKIKDACIAKNTALILSYHNFETTPAKKDLLEILRKCYEQGADVAKIACMSNDAADNARLLSLYDEPGRKVVLGMGLTGKITRFSAIPLGAEFTFAALSEQETTAPGQPTVGEIKSFLSLIS
jgi:3-dehydroquinate dehydratase type I